MSVLSNSTPTSAARLSRAANLLVVTPNKWDECKSENRDVFPFGDHTPLNKLTTLTHNSTGKSSNRSRDMSMSNPTSPSYFHPISKSITSKFLVGAAGSPVTAHVTKADPNDRPGW